MKFLGYRREDGSVGIRNHVLILATVNCASEVACKTAQNLLGAVSFVNPNGCGETAQNLQNTRNVLLGIAANPNVYGVVVVGLGCEINNADDFILQLKKRTTKPVERVVIQEEGGTLNAIAKATRVAAQMIIQASRCQREECDFSELLVGLECGGSDATSGLAANPVVGFVSDMIVAEGGTVMFNETPEMIGVEHILAKRAINENVAKTILRYVEKREQDMKDAGEDIRTGEPCPGNIAGGITTLEEKSLGCVYKGGHTPITEMVAYAQTPTKKGLVLMDSPSYDPVGISAEAAAGCQIVLFTTGRGNGLGNPVLPVMKMTANGSTYRSMTDNFDFDLSSVLESGTPLEDMAEKVVEEMTDILSGKLTKAEVYQSGYVEVGISRVCDYC